MHNFVSLIKQKILQALEKGFPEEKFTQADIEVTWSTQEKFGDYQCNSAMRLSKKLRLAPKLIATKIVNELIQDSCFAKIEVEGPGFINFYLSSEVLVAGLQELFADEHLGVPLSFKGKKYVVEFSSPNIAKEMHVGHLRSTIIGDCIARLFEFLGADVLRLNHVGDWGTAFGMLIAYLQEKEPQQLQKELTLQELMFFYKESKKLFDQDESFKECARNMVILLQKGDPQVLAIWEKICHISRVAFQEIYEILDVVLIERGESFYNPELQPIVEKLEAKGLITLSEGAKCIFHEGIKIPLMVQKSDGGYNYDTTDMAAIIHRVHQEKAERIIVVTDAGQSLHFDLVYKTAVLAEELDPSRVRFDHVPFGLVLGPDGKKFRTRSGETEKLIDLITAAIAKAEQVLEEKGFEGSREEKASLAKILGIDAIKYADLSCNRRSDYVFSYDRMLRFEGNTAAFILYSYVRTLSIQRALETLPKEAVFVISHPSEHALALHLLRFQEVLWLMSEELLPNHLTDYLYILAHKFNQFFRDCRVKNDPQEKARASLCKVVERTFATGLKILGLRLVEKM